LVPFPRDLSPLFWPDPCAFVGRIVVIFFSTFPSSICAICSRQNATLQMVYAAPLFDFWDEIAGHFLSFHLRHEAFVQPLPHDSRLTSAAQWFPPSFVPPGVLLVNSLSNHILAQSNCLSPALDVFSPCFVPSAFPHLYLQSYRSYHRLT